MGTRPLGNPSPAPAPWLQQQPQPAQQSHQSQQPQVRPSNGNGLSNGAHGTNGKTNNAYTQMQTSTLAPYEPSYDASYSKSGGEYRESGRHDGYDGQEIPLFSPESLAYTSQAAEHWRKSWRDRQYAEAGPAENVSKGQAYVPPPLLTMQNSFVRMRAVVQKQAQDKRKMTFGFWMMIFVMLCLILGMGAFIVYSYLPGITGSNANSAQAARLTPSLSLVGAGSTTFTIGQTIHAHGAHFGANDAITFLLDTATPILSSTGSPLTVRADSQGAFDVAIPITASWSIGDHNIQAVDAHANISSYLDIQVGVAGKPEKSSPNLSISLNGQAITSLAFTKQVGQTDPPAQRITITNTSGAPLQWTASAQADHNLQWLSIDDNNYQGQLDISQPYSIGISVDTTGLSVTTPNKPYTGQILFTINGKELLTLQVQLTIIDTTPEMVFSPQPITATANPDGTCKAGATLTLINLGSAVIHWSANPDLQNIIQFTNNLGVVTESGVLQPSGQDGDTFVLNVKCSGVQSGHQYHVSIYANSLQSSDTIYIQ
jgi:hypothetical protein